METNAIGTVELVRRHRILKRSSLKEAYEAVKDGWYENAPAEQIASLLSVNKQLLEALRLSEGRLAMLMRAELRGSDHPDATQYVLDRVRAAIQAAKVSS